MWVAAEPGGVVHFGAGRLLDVGVEGAGADGLAEGAAARAVSSAVVIGFADEGFVHGTPYFSPRRHEGHEEHNWVHHLYPGGDV